MVAVMSAFSAPGWADQPKLGFSGTLVRVRGQEPLKGYRVDSVDRDSLAAKMGLKRGDIVMHVGETLGFTTREAYQYALRQQGQTTKIGVVRSRDGKLTWLNCPLGHNPQPHADESPPDGVVAVDFAHHMRDAP
jgi:S1-C subfamily serine protease